MELQAEVERLQSGGGGGHAQKQEIRRLENEIEERALPVDKLEAMRDELQAELEELQRGGGGIARSGNISRLKNKIKALETTINSR